MPAKKDLSIYQGDDYELVLRIRSRSVDGVLGPYVNLTGWTGKAQVRVSYEQENVDAEFNVVVAANQATPDNTGKVTLTLTAAQTRVLSGSYLWDFQLTNPQQKVTTYLAGTLVCDREVTR